MANSHRLAVLTVALAASAGSFAADAENSEAVQTLKSSIGNIAGFEVDTVRMGDDGVTCIVYRVNNDRGGETKAQAVVEGDKVLRSTSRSKEFENAWNGKCVGAGSKSKDSRLATKAVTISDRLPARSPQ
jgi:hypothetical protein